MSSVTSDLWRQLSTVIWIPCRYFARIFNIIFILFWTEKIFIGRIPIIVLQIHFRVRVKLLSALNPICVVPNGRIILSTNSQPRTKIFGGSSPRRGDTWKMQPSMELSYSCYSLMAESGTALLRLPRSKEICLTARHLRLGLSANFRARFARVKNSGGKLCECCVWME